MPLVPGRGSLAVFKQLSANSESRLCGVPLGLELNSKKCEWSWLNPDCNLVCPIDGVPITPTNEFKFFPSVLRSLLRSLSKGTFSLISRTQAAIFLLRLSFGIVRATHFM